jgi:hypothetical protein
MAQETLSIKDCRVLHNEELRNFYSSPNVIRVSNSRWMRWLWLVARRGLINARRILAKKIEGKYHLVYLDFYWRIILKWILEK